MRRKEDWLLQALMYASSSSSIDGLGKVDVGWVYLQRQQQEETELQDVIKVVGITTIEVVTEEDNYQGIGTEKELISQSTGTQNTSKKKSFNFIQFYSFIMFNMTCIHIDS